MARTWSVPDRFAGERLDKALSELAADLSRRAVRRLVEQGAVYLDGHRSRVASRPVRAGAVIRLESEEPAPRGEGKPAEVLWEGEGLVALAKPAGIPLVPTRASAEGCLLARLARERGVPLSALHPVHRLDAATSGVVLVALDRQSAAFLGKALGERKVEKTYLAWVRGVPEPRGGEWAWPLTAAKNGVVGTGKEGRSALTRFEVVEVRGRNSLLSLNPVTGRTHQIRAHCALAGHPVLGDARYGGKATGVRRVLLHALRITFPLPISGRDMTLQAPVPEDMADPPGP